MSFALPFLSTDFEKLMLVFCLLFRDSYRTKNYFALGKWNANAKKKKNFVCLLFRASVLFSLSMHVFTGGGYHWGQVSLAHFERHSHC